MKYIIPESLKPSDVRLDFVETSDEALRLLLWLREVLRDINQQIDDRGKTDQFWLLKARAAQRATSNLVHRTVEKLDNLMAEASLQQAVFEAVLGLPREEAEHIIQAAMKKRPHLEPLSTAMFDPPTN